MKTKLTTIPSTRVQELQNGAFLTTIPKSIADSKKIAKGSILEWFLDEGNHVVVVVRV